MTVLRYNSEFRMALADSPDISSEEDAALCECTNLEPLTIQDWQTYFVRFYGDVPSFFPQPINYYCLRKFHDNLFEIGFRNVVGQTRIGPVLVRVESRKISAPVYESLLDFITEKFSNLVFSFSTPAGEHYLKEKAGRDIAYIEYLFLKKFLLDSTPDLDGITALILANPHNKFNREYRRTPIDSISSISPSLMVNLFSSPDHFATLAVLGQQDRLIEALREEAHAVRRWAPR